ncbi:MAG: hypothetical protein Q4D04_14950 [Clostridia bacterium]|nr:hypothetical protein [Clostridia bacterium]
MMEKQRLEQPALNERHYDYQYAVPVGAQEIHVRGALRQSEREAMA